MPRRFAGIMLALLVFSVPALAGDSVTASPAPVKKANYELAAQWTASKIGKLIFDMAVTPHWLDSGDRFWYTFENHQGRKFYMVDPAKKTKALVFDPVKLAAQLTAATGLPYDSQHLPITTIRFVKNDSIHPVRRECAERRRYPRRKEDHRPAVTTVSTDAASRTRRRRRRSAAAGGRARRRSFATPPGRNQKSSYFEYELATGKLTLLEERAAAQACLGLAFRPTRRPWSSPRITTST